MGLSWTARLVYKQSTWAYEFRATGPSLQIFLCLEGLQLRAAERAMEVFALRHHIDWNVPENFGKVVPERQQFLPTRAPVVTGSYEELRRDTAPRRM